MSHSRWDDALFAQAGAVNPGALALRLAEHIRKAMDDGGGTDAARRDPACRLITHQIAYLMGLEFGWPDGEYEQALKICAARASPDVVRMCAPEYAPKEPAS